MIAWDYMITDGFPGAETWLAKTLTFFLCELQNNN